MNTVKITEYFLKEDAWKELHENVSSLLLNNPTIVVDCEDVFKVTPSLAYVVFGKLVDKFGEKVFEKLEIINDRVKFHTKIKNAIEKRVLVLNSQKEGD